VLLDIEGTTTPVAFVYDVLFPFARAELAGWCQRHAGSDPYRRIMTELAAEHASDRARGERVPPWDEATPEAADRSLQAYVSWLMDVDRKSPGLKRLQGLIWEEGYRAGALRGEVYPDVARALARWRADGIRTAIYSSGSELAQKRLFESTPSGNLSALIDGYFDTAVGPKTDPASYAAIASRLTVSPEAIVFVSDVTAELSAAARAGCRPVLCVRPGNSPQADAAAYRQITSFEDLDVQPL
jgi:enolase-phosphatase E1